MKLQLNTLSPDVGSRRKAVRVGRGIGSGIGKTCGRGHKGQKARKSGNVSPAFQGGQMPLQRRLPKMGFRSGVGLVTEEVRLHEIAALQLDRVNLHTLKDAGVIRKSTRFVKVMNTGEILHACTVQGLRVTDGARKAIEAVGGHVEA
ncbi:MAG: 50S ribosomal protein L15 [Legionellaceae bacterium]|nr:50S ribosomal protein L15 [Legionellaceae bacterium]